MPKSGLSFQYGLVNDGYFTVIYSLCVYVCVCVYTKAVVLIWQAGF